MHCSCTRDDLGAVVPVIIMPRCDVALAEGPAAGPGLELCQIAWGLAVGSQGRPGALCMTHAHTHNSRRSPCEHQVTHAQGECVIVLFCHCHEMHATVCVGCGVCMHVVAGLLVQDQQQHAASGVPTAAPLNGGKYMQSRAH